MHFANNLAYKGMLMKQFIFAGALLLQCASFSSLHAMEENISNIYTNTNSERAKELIKDLEKKEIIIAALFDCGEEPMYRCILLEKMESGKYQQIGGCGFEKESFDLIAHGATTNIDFSGTTIKVTKQSFNDIKTLMMSPSIVYPLPKKQTELIRSSMRHQLGYLLFKKTLKVAFLAAFIGILYYNV